MWKSWPSAVEEPEAVAASEVFGAGADWLKWTVPEPEPEPEEESGVKSWTESVIKENDQVRERSCFDFAVMLDSR